MIDQIGGRKLAALILMVLIGVGTTLWKGDVPANFLTLMEFAFGAFVAGNAVEHGANAYTNVNGSQEAPAAPSDTAAQDALHTLLESQQALQTGVSVIQQTLAAIVKAYKIQA